MQERRVKTTDRRQHSRKLPLRDYSGNQIFLERRYFPDRRISHYDPFKHYNTDS